VWDLPEHLSQEDDRYLEQFDISAAAGAAIFQIGRTTAKINLPLVKDLSTEDIHELRKFNLTSICTLNIPFPRWLRQAHWIMVRQTILDS
jgi:hypothetical protein